MIYAEKHEVGSFKETLLRWIQQQPIHCDSIEAFYERSANDKWRALLFAGLCFFVGIFMAMISILAQG